MMRNQIQLGLLAVALLALPAIVHAQFTYTTNNGAITITAYAGTNGNVVIPGMTNGYPVTSIGNSAFYNCTSVTNVGIPGSVTNIDVQAFTGCGLTGVIIPDSVLSIKQSAFLNCSSLGNIAIGSNVINIGHDAFWGCSSLTNVFIPKSVTSIYSMTFTECSRLTNITVDVQNPAYSSVNGVLFDKNQTTLIEYPYGMAGNYTIPNSVTNIGQYAFYGCKAASILIPNSVVVIGQSAFSGIGLTNVVIPDGVTTIGAGAFSGINVTNVVIPESVTNIGPAAFSSSSIMTITVAANNPAYSSIGGVLFDGRQTTLVEFPIGKSGTYLKPGSYTIPSGVIGIGDEAFEGCDLGNITIPDSVTSIGAATFNECVRLSNLIIPNNVTNIGNGAFEATGLTNIIIPASVITFGWLGYCPSLRSVYFEGNAPGQGNGIPPVLSPLSNATAYYLPGTTGWAPYFQVIVPTTLWLPQVQTAGTSFGVLTNQFGFNLNWASGQTVAVDACTNLANPVWQPLQTNTLTTGSVYFKDPQWTNYPGRFYRLRSL